MTVQDLWASLPPDLQTLLLGAAGKLTAGLLERALVTLGAAVRGTPQERALRAAYAQAGAAFLACLDLPEDSQARRDMLAHVQSLLAPLFADDRVQVALTDAVLLEGRPEAVDPAPIQAAWAELYGPDAETTLPWRAGLGLPDAIHAFARAFEREAEACPELHPFLIAARLKRLVDQQERGVRVVGMDDLIQTIQNLTGLQERFLTQFLQDLPDSQRRRAETLYQIALYRQALVRYCEELPYVSLPGARGKRPSLSTLYVHRRAQQRSDATPPPPPERMPTEEAVRRHHHLVLLGEPGAGKTTWLHHTIQCLAEGQGEEVGITEPLLPILVRLGPLSRREGNFPDRLRVVLENELGLSLPADFFTAWPAAAGARGWLLACDGLDEGGDTETRQTITRWLEGLAEGTYRVLITSRPAGYEAASLKEPAFALFELEPFTPQEAETFARRWFGAFLSQEQAQEKASALLREAEDRGLAGLLSNPLLVTVLAVVYHEQGTFPGHRKDLYAEFIRVLLSEAERRGLVDALEQALHGSSLAADLVLDTPRLLGEVALAAHQQRAANEETLADAAAHALADGMSKYKTREVAKRWIQVMGRWSGVLVARGAGYEFLHPTFREYLAARVLAEAHESDPDGLWAELGPRILDDEWTGVIPLALAHLGDAMSLLARLLAANAEDAARQRPLFLAAAALAEGASGSEALRRQVVDGLEHQIRTRPFWEMLVGTGTSPSDALVALGRLEGDSYATARLEVLVRACGEIEPLLRAEAVRALRRLGRVGILSKLARDSTLGPVLCIEAAEALGHLGRTDEAASVLLPLAQDISLHEGIRYRSVRDLVELGRAGEAEPILPALAHGDEVLPQIRVAAAQTMGELGRVNEATSVLLSLIRDGTIDSGLRQEAVSALGKLDQTDDLLALAQDKTVNTEIRVATAKTLGERGWTGIAISVLLEVARDGTMNAEVRWQAAEVLCHLNRTDDAIPILLTLVRDDTVDAVIRHRSAWTLSQAGRADDAARVWLALAQDSAVDTNTRREATSDLGYLGRVNELLALARDNAILPEVREQAIWELGQLGRFDALLSMARDRGIVSRIRLKAAKTLGHLGLADEAVPSLSDLKMPPSPQFWGSGRPFPPELGGRGAAAEFSCVVVHAVHED